MSSTVFCGNCGTPLDESPSTPPENRIPCPSCGSTRRSIHVSATDAITTTDSASAVLIRQVTDAATLLTQAVIIVGDKTHEGVLVQSVTTFWNDLVRLFEQQPDLLYQVDPFKLEEIVAGLCERHGFDVTLTPRSGDLGRDVIAIRPGFGTVRLIESVKRYGPGHLVPADDVRALAGVLSMDPKASKGIVTTTSDFAPRIEVDPLIKPFMPYRIELVNGKELLKRLSDVAK